MALAALLPVIMAPLLDVALGAPPASGAARVTWSELSLKNLGAAFFQWLGISTVEDRFRAIVLLCAAYVGGRRAEGRDGLRELPPGALDPCPRRRRHADGSLPAPGRALDALFHRTARRRARLTTQHGHRGGRRRARDDRGHGVERSGPHRDLRLPPGPHEPAARGGGARRHRPARRGDAIPARSDPAARHGSVLRLRGPGGALPGSRFEHPGGQVVRRRAIRDGPREARRSTA